MRINYGINRRAKGRKFIEHKNGTMTIRADSTCSQVVAKIQAKHPGWLVTGYCPAIP